MTNEEEYQAWCATRPSKIAKVAQRFRPWLEYQFKNTKRLCHLYSFEEHEDGSVTLKVLQPDLSLPGVCDNLVFGVLPDDIEPTDEHCVRPPKGRIEIEKHANGENIRFIPE